MSLEPLFQASMAIQVHAFAAMAAFVLGIVQLVGPKGTLPHRLVGWMWVVLMTVVAMTAFWIHELRMIGPWSPIHLLSFVTLGTLPFMIMAARQHKVNAHRTAAFSLFFGALIIAGLFTFVPGRIMYEVVTGA